jgi:3-oxoacyl-[acyl-carrier protein] reductase
MDLGLTGKVAIITGGSDGIGKAAAQRMAAEGARAVIVARRPEVLEAAAQDIRTATGGTVLPIQGDVTEPETINRALEMTLNNFGRVDILVNNAGTSMARPFEAVSDTDWESDFNRHYRV